MVMVNLPITIPLLTCKRANALELLTTLVTFMYAEKRNCGGCIAGCGV